MCSSLVRRVITLLLAQSLFLPIASAQQQETRPRRTQPVWTPPSATTPIIASPALTTTTGPEPTIRVALTTDARSAVISTTGHLMNASGGSSTLVALDTSRVRVDPRLLSPRQTVADDATFRVIVGGAATREEAEENEKEIQKAAGEDAHTIYDTETKTWGMIIGSTHPREEAEEIRARLEAAGFDATDRWKGTGNSRTNTTARKQQQPGSIDLAFFIAVARSCHFICNWNDLQFQCASRFCFRRREERAGAFQR